MSEVLMMLIVLLLFVLLLAVGAGIGYLVASRHRETNTLTKEEMDSVRQIINLLTFTGEPQPKRGE